MELQKVTKLNPHSMPSKNNFSVKLGHGYQGSHIPQFWHFRSTGLIVVSVPDGGVFVVEDVLCGDDGDDPGGTQVLHHGVQRHVAVLPQELVRVTCRYLGCFYIEDISEVQALSVTVTPARVTIRLQ